MNLLDQFGWQAFLSSTKYSINEDQKPARVISLQGFRYTLITEQGEKEAEVAGKLLYTLTVGQLPKVGDWVLFLDYEEIGYIIEVLPRLNSLSRKVSGNTTEEQVLATNIDAALIVQGLDRDFNINRLERYLAQIISCHIPAIIILNKVDLITNRNDFLTNVSALKRDALVVFSSTLTGEGLDELVNEILKPLMTYLLVGSSGVGKSSLLNSLSADSKQAVAETSIANQKGKHTTTHRELFQLPNGSLLIDTPGMREFGLTHAGDDDQFPVIARIAADCKFSDCKHLQEAGCAVLAALENGSLDRVVYDNYIKLEREQRRFHIDAEEKKRQEKMFGRMTREAKNHRRRFKF